MQSDATTLIAWPTPTVKPLGTVVLASQTLSNPDFLLPRCVPLCCWLVMLPMVCLYGRAFWPHQFCRQVAVTAAGIALSERVVCQHGALTVGLYSTRQEVIDAMTEATWRGKVALSINLTGVSL